MGDRILRFIEHSALLWMMWLALTSSLDPQEIIAGSFFALLGAVLVQIVAPQRLASGTGLHPRRLLALLAYVPWLLLQIFLSNIDVATRVLHPKLPIHPGIVRVKTRLQSPIGRMILANSITLTPGTLSVDIEGDELCVHWIDARASDVDEATRAIVSGFERRLEVLFG